MIYKKNAFTFPEVNRYYQQFEYMFILSKGKPKSTNLIQDRENKWAGSKAHGTNRKIDGDLKPLSAIKNKTNRKIKKFGVRSNIWEYDVGNYKSTKDIIAFKHPAIFPDKLAQDHILSWSNEGDIVLDCFMGSGTTGKMALLNNRKFIGIEKVKEYFNIANERINMIINKEGESMEKPKTFEVLEVAEMCNDCREGE